MVATVDVLPALIQEKLKNHRVTRSLRRPSRVYADTTSFTSIDYGDIILVDNSYFLVTGYTREGRFGVDDQTKPWVPRVEELATGNRYIMKLVFHETFDVTMGQFTISYYRNPEKEARVLEMVQDHPRFMHGRAVLDEAGNLVRILDIINGRRLDKYIHLSGAEHEEYFYQELPGILQQFAACVDAIGLLHQNGFRHGDIRRDHIFVERKTDLFRWIDFDYDYYMPEKPFAVDLYELGNLLMYLVVRRNFHPREIMADPALGERVINTIEPGDFALLSKNRVVNLQKLFPYIPTSLNNIFLHFSLGTDVFYDTVTELRQDLETALSIPWSAV
jgi:hypothetical protein